MILDFASHRSVLLSVYERQKKKWTIFADAGATDEENYRLIRDITARMRETREKARVIRV